jgi:NADH-quinone oxidoreductase subunit C
MLTYGNIIKVLPILRLELYYKENNFLFKTNLITKVITIIKNHFKYQFKVITCISGVDYPENLYRFNVIYELLSIKFNSRIRLKIVINELTPVNSIENIFPGASWYECEIWDLYGVFFINKVNLTKLLTDYGFQGYPLRKDFPLTGFTELRYNNIKNRIVYENMELAQEYRIFDFLSPWENYKKIDNEKIIN